jgi:hypothetical protein
MLQSRQASHVHNSRSCRQTPNSKTAQPTQHQPTQLTLACSLSDSDKDLDGAVLAACLLEVRAGSLCVKRKGLACLHQLDVTKLDRQLILVKLNAC